MSVSWIQPFYGDDCNVFLLKGTKNILIDTGCGFTDDLVKEVLELLNGDSLDMVILTHCHFDHIGGLKNIVGTIPCKLYAGPDAAHIRNDSEVTLAKYFHNVKMGSFEVSQLKDGEIIDTGSHRLRVIYTPGHTAGGIVLYDELDSSLFSGDTLFRGGIGRCDFPTGSVDDYKITLNVLSNLDIKTLYPGHGPLSNDGNKEVINGLNMLGV